MPQVAKLTESLFAEVCDALLGELDANVDRDAWRRTFVGHGWHADDYHGHVLLNDGKPVGVLGMLFSERRIDGVVRKFCNLHAWYVKPEYRAQSLFLLRPALALQEHTLTDYSPTPSVTVINQRLGFSTLDDAAFLMFPLPWRAPGAAEIIALQSEPDAVSRYLSEPEQRIFRDHQHHDCDHLLIRRGQERCYVVSSRIAGPRFSYCDIHYLSDRHVFVSNHADVRNALIQRSGASCVLIESRLLSGVRPPYAMRLATLRKMFRPVGVAAEQVDNLYSEIVSLKISTLPGIKVQLQAKARHLFGVGRS